MKKIILALAFAGVSMSLSAADWGNIERYDSVNAIDRLLPEAQRRVVFFGNSITEGWPKAHPEFFTSNGFLGRGISGQTSYQFLVRFREDAINLQPQIVVFTGAANDIAENTCPYNEDNSYGNIVSLIQLAQANGLQPVLGSCLPAARFGWRPEIIDAPDKIESLNARLKKYAEENGIPYVDYYTPMVTSDGTRALRPEYTYDGVHPTADGYTVMEKAVMEVIEPLLKK